MRVRAAGEGTTDVEPEEWLIVEWPKGEEEPTKFWLSTLPEDIAFARMIDITMMRWRIVPKARFQRDERDYQELKQEVGLGHFEGRSWRGFHHHATMCVVAYGFLVAERGAFPPSGPLPILLRKTCHSPRLPTQRLPRSGLSATSPTRSQRSADVSMSVSSRFCRAARAVPDLCTQALDAGTCDAVRLGRSLCSLLPRPFGCECHSISTMPRFQPPPRRTQHAVFPHCALLFASQSKAYGTYRAGATFGCGLRTR